MGINFCERFQVEFAAEEVEGVGPVRVFFVDDSVVFPVDRSVAERVRKEVMVEVTLPLNDSVGPGVVAG